MAAAEPLLEVPEPLHCVSLPDVRAAAASPPRPALVQAPSRHRPAQSVRPHTPQPSPKVNVNVNPDHKFRKHLPLRLKTNLIPNPTAEQNTCSKHRKYGVFDLPRNARFESHWQKWKRSDNTGSRPEESCGSLLQRSLVSSLPRVHAEISGLVFEVSPAEGS